MYGPELPPNFRLHQTIRSLAPVAAAVGSVANRLTSAAANQLYQAGLARANQYITDWSSYLQNGSQRKSTPIRSSGIEGISYRPRSYRRSYRRYRRTRRRSFRRSRYRYRNKRFRRRRRRRYSRR